MKRKTLLFLAFCLLVYIPAANGEKISYEFAFSPHGRSLHIVLRGIEYAEKSILVAAYSFTSKPIAEALLTAHKRGVRVAVVADRKGNANRYSVVPYLARKGIPVRLNGRYTIMHHKFMVIDGSILQLGSFNYSASAVDKNAENVLLLKGVSTIAAGYTEEWCRLWDEGVDALTRVDWK